MTLHLDTPPNDDWIKAVGDGDIVWHQGRYVPMRSLTSVSKHPGHANQQVHAGGRGSSTLPPGTHIPTPGGVLAGKFPGGRSGEEFYAALAGPRSPYRLVGPADHPANFYHGSSSALSVGAHITPTANPVGGSASWATADRGAAADYGAGGHVYRVRPIDNAEPLAQRVTGDPLDLGEYVSVVGWEVVADVSIDKHMSGKHDQATHGRGGGKGSASISSPSALDTAQAGMANSSWGGYTVTTHGSFPKEGYAVAVERSASKVIEGDKVTPEQIGEWRREHSATLSEPGNHMGGWHDTENHVIVLDISRVFPNSQEGYMEALKFGQDHDELSIYSLHDGAEIPTGGTGGYAKGAPKVRHQFGDEMTDEEIAAILNGGQA